MAILVEHYAGNFPFWLAAVQASILPISDAQLDYAKQLEKKLDSLGFRVTVDARNEKISRKIAESEQKKIPFALIIGQKEVDNNSVSVRQHTKGDIGIKTQDEIINIFTELKLNYK